MRNWQDYTRASSGNNRVLVKIHALNGTEVKTDVGVEIGSLLCNVFMKAWANFSHSICTFITVPILANSMCYLWISFGRNSCSECHDIKHLSYTVCARHVSLSLCCIYGYTLSQSHDGYNWDRSGAEWRSGWNASFVYTARISSFSQIV